MVRNQLERPGGEQPPLRAADVDLPPIAAEVARRHLAAHPEEVERYGEMAREWCEHDTRWLLAWAAMEVAGHGVKLAEQVDWLAKVLGSRGYPLSSLADVLDACAEVSEGALPPGAPERLREASARVRSREP